MKERMITIGDNLQLRPISPEPEVISRYVVWFNDPEVTRFLKKNTLGAIKKATETITDWQKDPKRIYFIIYSGEEPIGHVGLKEIDLKSGTAWVGIVIGEKSCWGQGIGAKSIEAIKTIAIQGLNLTTLFAEINPANDRSINLFNGCNFIVGSQSEGASVYRCDLQ